MYDYALVYSAAVLTDFDTGIMNCTGTRAYTVKSRKNKDQDNSTFHEAMHVKYAAEYQRAMVAEVKESMRQQTWKRIHRNNVPLD